MANEVTVFVVFNPAEVPAPVNVRGAALHVSREQPRWSIGDVGQRSFRLGRYDQLPVLVTLREGADVLEESKIMAKRVDVDDGKTERAEFGSARFELFWDLRQDQDVVPETATLVVRCAQALAQLTKGVVLIGGSRLIPDDAELSDGQAFAALFPNHGGVQKIARRDGAPGRMRPC